MQHQAKSEDREYSHTGLVFAAILAISSLIPIAGGAILHVVRRSAILHCPLGVSYMCIYVHIDVYMCINAVHPRLQNENYYQSSVIHRVDTNASTHPMMSNFEVNSPPAILMNTTCFGKSLFPVCQTLIICLTIKKPSNFVNFLLLQEKVGFQSENLNF